MSHLRKTKTVLNAESHILFPVPTTSLAEVAPDDEKRLYDQDSSLKHKEIAAVDERKLLRKIDLRLVPVLCILYLLAFLDRYVRSSARGDAQVNMSSSVNISNASLFGLKQDLKLEGDQYNTALVILYVLLMMFSASISYLSWLASCPTSYSRYPQTVL